MGTQDAPIFFGDWIKEKRKALDLTQDELAQRAGCSVFAIRKIESGDRRPSKQLASLLATALDIPEEDQQTFVRVARGERGLEKLYTHPISPDTPSFQKAGPETAPTILPRSLTPLFGREPELAAMERIFVEPHCRLLTLTGLGGIGKTRLAIEFAQHQSSSFPGGVYYVPLASLDSPNLIAPAIADSLGFSFSGSVPPKDQLISYISRHIKGKTLFVLDNLEHLLGDPSQEKSTFGAADLVAEFLYQLPHIKILATSRERLNLHGEWTYELHGLALPPDEFAEDLESYSAVSLFIESVRRVNAGFELTAEEQPAVVRIVQFVEGIPLAIELATCCSEVLSPTEIAREIETNLDMLATSMRDIPERHRSIRATFDHSWRLLTDEERSVMCQLSVFQGGFDRAAADEVAGASLPVLASLASKSLVRRTASGRYDLHEVIRQYTFSNLLSDPHGSEVRDLHSVYYLGIVRDREYALKSAGQREAFRELMAEMDNVRAAWAWGIERGKLTPISGAVRSLGWLFETAGLLREGINQFELLIRGIKAREKIKGWESVLGLALAQQSLLLFRKGEFYRAETLLEESLSILRPLGTQADMVDPLTYLGIIQHLNGELERSRSTMEEGLACAQAVGDQWFAAYAIFNLGYIDSLVGRYEEGHEQMTAGLSTWQTLGDPRSIALGYNFLSTTLIKLGRFEEATINLQESIKLSEGAGDRWGSGTAHRYLGLVKMAQGNLSKARSLFQESLDIFSGFVKGWDIALSLIFLGEATMGEGNLEEASQFFLDGLREAQDAKSVPLKLDALLGLANIRAREGDYERAAQLSSFIYCHVKSAHETKNRAGELLSKMEKQIPPAQWDEAREQAANQSLEAIVAQFFSGI